MVFVRPELAFCRCCLREMTCSEWLCVVCWHSLDNGSQGMGTVSDWSSSPQKRHKSGALRFMMILC